MNTPAKSGLLSISLIFLAVFIFTFSFIRESAHQVQARLGVNPTPIPLQYLLTQVPSHGNYQLPHPGLLPTNPLYPLKMIRDRAGLFLTTNPTKKSQLLLHYANKRIAAANQLIQSGLSGEALSTAIKAEIYLGQAINSGPQVDPSFRSSFFDGLQQATLKHEEIIEKIVELSEGETHNQAIRLHQQLDQYRHQIVSLSGEPFRYPRPEDCEVPSASPSATPSPTSTEPHL